MILRTYEQFEVRFARGTTISGYESKAAAVRAIEWAGEGTLIRKTFGCVMNERDAVNLFRPGFSDEILLGEYDARDILETASTRTEVK